MDGPKKDPAKSINSCSQECRSGAREDTMTEVRMLILHSLCSLFASEKSQITTDFIL